MTDIPEALAQRFHETYERLAPSFGYETREASAKPWADVPEQNKRLMIAVCGEILASAGVAGLVSALEPFANHPDFLTPDDWAVTKLDDGWGAEDVPGVTAGDFRRARAALSSFREQKA